MLLGWMGGLEQSDIFAREVRQGGGPGRTALRREVVQGAWWA
eukprot:COSAG02_NODE_73_length_41919_cov_6.571066_4_plen_42_part_00